MTASEKGLVAETISRRAVLGGITTLVLPFSARAASPEQLSVDADEGSVALARYATDHAGKRAAVLVLHGAGGIERKPRAYERYADALTAGGIDVYFVRYLTSGDQQSLAAASTRERREAYETERFEGWSRRISSVVTAILARAENSGRIGLLGFS